MELRTVDPRVLLPNPHNPRRTKVLKETDAQMIASIVARGVLQPPVVQASLDDDGAERLTIVFGNRRAKNAIAAGCETIQILVRTDVDLASDPMDAVAENIVRAEMGAVDRWRAMETLAANGWTDAAIGEALALSPRAIAQLRLLGRICPPMLEQMARNDMPGEGWLRIIASAKPDAQLSVWKQHKPKKNETAQWYAIANALRTSKLYARDARFGDDEAAAFGIVWEEDLFAPAGEDSRSTTQIEAYHGAQQAWLDANLPKHGVLTPINERGSFDLPKGARPGYGKPGKGDRVACGVHPESGEIVTLTYTPIEVLKQKTSDAAKTATEDETQTDALPKTPRPDVTQKGMAMIGDLRTDALHQALRQQPMDPTRLIALLVLALGSDNVSVRTGVKAQYGSGALRAAAASLITDGVLYEDEQTVHAAARAVLVQVLSCRDDQSNSGLTARIAGSAIDADGFLVSMATTDFLPCMTKTALGREADAVGVRVEPRGKDTQANLIERFKEGTWVYPGARFAITETERAAALAKKERQLAAEARWGRNASLNDDDTDGDDDLDDQGSDHGIEPPDASAEESPETSPEVQDDPADNDDLAHPLAA